RRAGPSSNAAAPLAAARVKFYEGPLDVAVYRREDLPALARLRAPCVVTEYSSTTLVPAGVRAATDARGNLVIEL
ncbi:MAG: hydantoinase/oxoprolinase family protein, partial [Acidobacteriota bacterium]|nr:hydantoinase/oxoprolinase family protein [Acidobacteriota bacterium]